MDELKQEQGELPKDLAPSAEAAPGDERDLMDTLKELVEFLKASAIAEFDLERPSLKLRLKFQGPEPAAVIPAPAFDMAQLARAMNAAQHPAAGVVAQAHVAPPAAAEPVSATATAQEANHIVKSPLVGTVYESPSPGAAPFVKVGDTVEVGQVLCIVEAMKLMNEIESDAAGEIVARIAASGHPVEYGQPLFEIKVR